MNVKRKWLVAPALVALVALAACAGNQPPAAGSAGAVTISVNNNVLPPTTLSVFLLPQDGVRELLGTVTPNNTESFAYNQPLVGGPYRLVAVDTEGQEQVSRGFSLVNEGSIIHWDVNANMIQIEG